MKTQRPLPLLVEARNAQPDDWSVHARLAAALQGQMRGPDYTATMSTTTAADGRLTISIRARPHDDA